MIKQLLLLTQLLGLFFYQILFTADLTVTQNMPASITQGEETVVEITINKEDLPGFAKIQQDFPAGFTAEPIETKGATFSFKDNKLKLIWMSLPVEKVFTISYKIVPDEALEGDFSLGGKFSFISESERKNIDIPVSNFNVVKKVLIEKPIIAEVVEEKVEEIIEEEVVVVEKVEVEKIVEEKLPVEEVAVFEEPIVEVEEITEKVVEEVVAIEKPSVIKIITITCNRTIEDLGNGKFKVFVEINKKGIEGFAKISERIPEGFIATENNSNTGVFSFKENTMKILWMGVPSDDVYTISYNLEAKATTENGEYDIVGFYSYLENEATSKYLIDGSGFELNVEPVIAQETTIVSPPKEEVVAEQVIIAKETVVVRPPKEELVASKPTVVEPVVVAAIIEEEPVAVVEKVDPIIKKNTTFKKTTVQSKKATTTPNPENGVTYKVQVGAGHKKVPSTYFATKFNLKDNVNTINHEGWIKYLVGSYNEYKPARDKRNKVRGNVKTAFVTAYNSGTRITVQEALMISNQKWYK